MDKFEPIGGVFQNNHVEFLNDEFFGPNAIDLDFEEHCKECNEEYHENCWEGQGTTLIGGWKKNKDGLYEPDKESEYSAIVGEIYGQVVWSKHVKQCRICSPCFPGQGNLDSEGDFDTYALPPDLVGK